MTKVVPVMDDEGNFHDDDGDHEKIKVCVNVKMEMVMMFKADRLMKNGNVVVLWFVVMAWKWKLRSRWKVDGRTVIKTVRQRGMKKFRWRSRGSCWQLRTKKKMDSPNLLPDLSALFVFVPPFL
ncbi:hypothetical protein RYX36_020313 [Vicia faba]